MRKRDKLKKKVLDQMKTPTDAGEIQQMRMEMVLTRGLKTAMIWIRTESWN